MLTLKDVSIGYHKVPLIENINLEIQPGTITAILGLNGAGKSTLLKTMLGLLEPISGTIMLDGQDFSAMDTTQRALKTSYVKQQQIPSSMSVRQLVLHGRFAHIPWPRRYTKEDYAKADEAMRQMGIENLSSKNLEELSGGERQKAYLALTLCQDTPYVFFDEPASYMDLPSQMELKEIMDRLKNQNKAVVVVEHDLIDALERADQIVLLDERKVRFAGRAESFLKSGLIEEVFRTSIESVKVDGHTRYFYKKQDYMQSC